MYLYNYTVIVCVCVHTRAFPLSAFASLGDRLWFAPLVPPVHISPHPDCWQASSHALLVNRV